MGRLQEGLAVGDMKYVPLDPGPLQDGVDEVVVDGLHHAPGVGFVVTGHRNVEDPHTPAAGILLPFIQRIAEFR